MKNDKCFMGYKREECPKRRLESEKLIYGILLVASVSVLIFCNIS